MSGFYILTRKFKVICTHCNDVICILNEFPTKNKKNHKITLFLHCLHFISNIRQTNE